MYKDNSRSLYSNEKQNKRLPFEVHKLEWTFLNDNNALSRVHIQTQFEMICVTAGTGAHNVNGEKYDVKSGSICAALPGQEHQLLAEPGIKGYILCFNPGYLHKTSESYKIADESILHHFFSRHCQLDIAQEQIAGILQVIAGLEKELSNCFLLRTEIVSNYLQILVLYIRREFERAIQSEEITGGSPLLKKFLLLLENNFKDKMSVADYARQLFVTPNYLNQVIKKTSGHPPGYHIRQRIVQEAKKRVRYSGASLKEIAYYLGFDNTAHFSRFFKDTSGINFTDFKREVYRRVVL